jgi:hypothetical protein
MNRRNMLVRANIADGENSSLYTPEGDLVVTGNNAHPPLFCKIRKSSDTHEDRFHSIPLLTRK